MVRIVWWPPSTRGALAAFFILRICCAREVIEVAEAAGRTVELVEAELELKEPASVLLPLSLLGIGSISSSPSEAKGSSISAHK